MSESALRAIWLDDPRDGLTHAWGQVVPGGLWQALCGLVAYEATLTTPEDEWGRHDACVLALGMLVADAQGTVSAWR